MMVGELLHNDREGWRYVERVFHDGTMDWANSSIKCDQYTGED